MLQTWNNGSPTAAFNNAAQAWNHEFYWESMSPKPVGATPMSCGSSWLCTCRSRFAPVNLSPQCMLLKRHGCFALPICERSMLLLTVTHACAELKGDLKKDIESTFGSVEDFSKEFSTAGATQVRLLTVPGVLSGTGLSAL